MTNAPREIWMPKDWEVMDGTMPVDRQADRDDLQYIRRDMVIVLAEVISLKAALLAFDPQRIGSGPSTDMRKLHEAQMQARAVLRALEGGQG